MNKKIKLILLLTGAFGLQRVFAGWQPVPYVGLDIDPKKAVFMIFPRVDSASGTSAFDEFRNEITLGEFIFGQSDVLLQDIFLASKVAGKGDTNVQPGNYLSLIGSTIMRSVAVQECTRTLFGSSYTMALGSSDVLWTNEIMVPVESYLQQLTVSYVGDGVGRTNTGAQTDPATFFESYSDIQSFVEKEILIPKRLAIIPLQSDVFIGSIRLVSALDFSNYLSECVSRWQVGFVAHLISPHEAVPDRVWPVEGGFGATYLGGFGQVFLQFNNISNPFCVVEVAASVPTNILQRVPMLKGPLNAEVVAGKATFGNSNILTSANLAGTSITKDFSLFDSTIPFFADQTVLVHRHRGPMIEVRVGNMVDCGPVQIKLWYEYAYRGTDSHRLSTSADPLAVDNVYDFAALAVHTKNSYNMICWKAAYEVDNVRFAFGTDYTVAGKTAPKYIVLSLEAEVAF